MKYIYSLAAVALISGCSAVKLERDPLLTWAPHAKASSFPMNYGVSHFGEDHEITYTKKNIATAEAKLGHVLDTSDPAAAPPRNYFVPHFGEDQDILDHRAALGWAEKNLHHTLEVKDFPTIKRDYFVPHFGEDSHITASKDSEKLASGILGHTWTPTKDADGAWELPSPQIEFKLVQTIAE